MDGPEILISGGGVAGPALAWWLHRLGFQPTVVERAPAPRGGGQAIDFRGEAHMSVLRRMGILDDIRARQTPRARLAVVDAHGRRTASLPADFGGGEVEILRGDLSDILLRHTRDEVEYTFGDHITALNQASDGVNVSFASGTERRFDLVVGADGVHSGVRELAFGPERPLVTFLGYHFALFSVPEDQRRDEDHLLYCEPGRMASPGMFVFAAEDAELARLPVETQRDRVASTYAGMPWRTSALVEAMYAAPDFYLDALCKVELDKYFHDRVALVGDAAYGAPLSGMGTGLSVVGAYVLAGELAAAGGDHTRAFPRYQRRMEPYAKRCQGNAGPILAPRGRFGIWRRNQLFRLMSVRALGGRFARMDMKVANSITLPDYQPITV